MHFYAAMNINYSTLMLTFHLLVLLHVRLFQYLLEKTWQLRIHCNLGPPETRSFAALIMTPMPSLKSLDLSAAAYSILTVDSLRYTLT